MIQNIPINQVLFLDIETVPQHAEWEDLTETEQYLWEKKTRFQRNEDTDPATFYTQRGGIMAEFGKIICISCGMLDKSGRLAIKSYHNDNEQILLQEFGELFNKPKLREVILCAHNGKEFDFPWIARRFLVNGMQPPKPFQLYGKKPWEIPHLDTMELWKFGDYKTFISLELLAYLLGIPTPKDDIDGSMVATTYYKDKDLFRVVQYCEKDVLTLANIFRRMRQEDVLERSEI